MPKKKPTELETALQTDRSVFAFCEPSGMDVAVWFSEFLFDDEDKLKLSRDEFTEHLAMLLKQVIGEVDRIEFLRLEVKRIHTRMDKMGEWIKANVK